MSRLFEMLRRTPLAGPVADIASVVRPPHGGLKLWQDARTTYRNAAFARDLPAPAADAPLLLVLSMSNNTYATKLECMQALALRRRGWRVSVLTSNLYSHAKRIFRAYGITDFVAFEDLVAGQRARSAMAAETERRAASPMDFQSVMAWTYREAWIGPQLLSSVSRRQFDGAPDPRDPEIREALLKLLAQSVCFVHAAEDYLARARPALILVNEPNYHVLGPFVDVAIARAIPTIHFTQPSREDALVQKKLTPITRRIHPNSITPETLDRLMQQPWGSEQDRRLDLEFEQRYGGAWKVQARNQPGTVDISADEVAAQLGLDPSKPTAVLFSHVLWDANLFYGKDIFENYGEWFIETVKAAVANPRLNWLVKLHPANIWKRKLSGTTDEYGELRLIREHIGALPDHVKILPADTKISTMSLFRMVDVGITVRGSIGYELPCFGVPVVTAGTGRYSGFGFTEDCTSRAQYLDRLAHLETIERLDPAQVRRARVHAHALFALRPWIYRSFRTVIGADPVDPLFQNLVPTVATDGEVAANADLDDFAAWAEQPAAIDYLAPLEQPAVSCSAKAMD
ncbi:hypothetical protein RPB_1537 [Rhodopseudomonas palustris HaA2]|uniref:Capsule polysaccharide biosynthesis n=1 Tax=Rhodopseudomonas palustris (strain HaA2) TaxID=316058 RepID=Q2IZW3_RHOP2|nr:hypothetical protein [Rhodopseudomonas palustris]ABD06247.1 hypothetical protein RPB_1537 [Rhodopseudomonas palustris HaA2]